MDKDKSFERQYSLNVARIKLGKSQERFEVEKDFFKRFEQDTIQDAKVVAILDVVKNTSHLDVDFHFQGKVEIPCDRCGQLYEHPIDERQRIFYAFDEEMKFEGYEVMYVNSQEPYLSIVQELYDFIYLAIPLRRVPKTDIHLCDPEILKKLGLDEQGNPLSTKDEKEEIDPRWEKLKKLRDQME